MNKKFYKFRKILIVSGIVFYTLMGCTYESSDVGNYDGIEVNQKANAEALQENIGDDPINSNDNNDKSTDIEEEDSATVSDELMARLFPEIDKSFEEVAEEFKKNNIVYNEKGVTIKYNDGTTLIFPELSFESVSYIERILEYSDRWDGRTVFKDEIGGKINPNNDPKYIDYDEGKNIVYGYSKASAKIVPSYIIVLRTKTGEKVVIDSDVIAYVENGLAVPFCGEVLISDNSAKEKIYIFTQHEIASLIRFDDEGKPFVPEPATETEQLASKILKKDGVTYSDFAKGLDLIYSDHSSLTYEKYKNTKVNPTFKFFEYYNRYTTIIGEAGIDDEREYVANWGYDLIDIYSKHPNKEFDDETIQNEIKHRMEIKRIRGEIRANQDDLEKLEELYNELFDYIENNDMFLITEFLAIQNFYGGVNIGDERKINLVVKDTSTLITLGNISYYLEERAGAIMASNWKGDLFVPRSVAFSNGNQVEYPELHDFAVSISSKD